MKHISIVRALITLDLPCLSQLDASHATLETAVNKKKMFLAI